VINLVFIHLFVMSCDNIHLLWIIYVIYLICIVIAIYKRYKQCSIKFFDFFFIYLKHFSVKKCHFSVGNLEFGPESSELRPEKSKIEFEFSFRSENSEQNSSRKRDTGNCFKMKK